MVLEYNNAPLVGMFQARDPAVHKSLKTPVASLFAMSNMRNYEPYVDECTQIFSDAMRDQEGQNVDLAVWLQWYAFDVVAGLTFQRRFGFLEQRKDVNDMIGMLDASLDSLRVLGQYPVLDGPAKWLLKRMLPLMGRYSPIFKFVEVSRWNDCRCWTSLISGTCSDFPQICEDEITRYDDSEKTGERTDFLSQLRQREAKLTAANPQGDARNEIINHLTSNLSVSARTIGRNPNDC